MKNVLFFPLLDQLKGKINLNVDDMDKLTVDDLRSQVDYAISQVIFRDKYMSEYQGLYVQLHWPLLFYKTFCEELYLFFRFGVIKLRKNLFLFKTSISDCC